MKLRRPYVMRARAESAARTREKALRATVELFYGRPGGNITLEQVAELAGVTVQTLLRIFGSRAELLREAERAAMRQVAEERRSTPGDVAEAVAALFDHYERVGPAVLGMLAQETLTGHPDLAAGRRFHETWVEEVFAPQLADLEGMARGRLQEALALATDVYIWKLLRSDRAQPRPRAEAAVRALVEAAIAARGRA